MELTESMSVVEILKKRDSEFINNFIQSNKFQQCILENSADLISSISGELSEELWRTNRDLFVQYTNILRTVSEKSDTNIIISLFEEIEDDVFHEKFIAVIGCISIVLHQLNDRRYFLQYSLELITTYVNNIRPPDDTYEYGEEIKMVKYDQNTKIISYIYDQMLQFSDSFINKLVSTNESNAMLLFHFNLLGNPFIFVNLAYNEQLYSVAQNILKFICSRINDVMSLLEYVDKKIDYNDVAQTEKTVTDIDLRDLCEEISMVAETCQDYKVKIHRNSFAGFFHVFFCHNSHHTYVPLVYDTVYIVNKMLYLCVEFLSIKNEISVDKGLSLSAKLFEKVQSGKMTRHCLNDIHKQFMSNLSAVGIYSTVQDNRTRAAKLLSQYFRKFDVQGKYLLFHRLAHLSDNSVFDGYIATLFKEEINYQLNKEELGDYFSGKRFADLVYHFCSFKNGAKVDVAEKSAEIVCVLNLLLFVYIRDKSNVTKIWDYVDIFKNKYYVELKEAVDRSYNDYKLRLHTFEKSNSNHSCEYSKLNVTVGGKSLKPLSHGDKIDEIKKDITSIDMVKYVLDNLYETVTSKIKNDSA